MFLKIEKFILHFNNVLEWICFQTQMKMENFETVEKFISESDMLVKSMIVSTCQTAPSISKHD